MRHALIVVPFIAFLGCGGSDADAPDAKPGNDARIDAPGTADTGKADVQVGPSDAAADQVKPDVADAATDRAADAGAADLIDARADDGVVQKDVPAAEAAGIDTGVAFDGADAAADRPQGETGAGLDGAQGPDGASSEGGESCTCDRALSWACFCSVESCGRMLADFVDYGDGGKAVRTGQQTVAVIEYAACNLVVVQAHTYSDYVPASEYVFDRATGTLVGATVQLDDRQHLCPWSGDARWVFRYTSGTQVPSSCAPSACLPGSGSCSAALDAQ